MNFAENIRRLRKGADVTQDDLAGYLGLSPQAISKWERGDAFPDITLLPSIAHFFKVTIDDLLGMDEERRRQRGMEFVRKITDFRAANGAFTQEEANELTAMLRSGLREFPDEEMIQLRCAGMLGVIYDTQGADRYAHQREAIAVYERLLKYSTDDEIRDRARFGLAFTYIQMDEPDKARPIIVKLAALGTTPMHMLTTIEKGEERVSRAQYSIFYAAQAICNQIELIIPDKAEESSYTTEQIIELYQMCVRVLETLYPDDPRVIAYLCAMYNYESAVHAALDGQTDRALDYLERMAHYDIIEDAAPRDVMFTGILADKLDFAIEDTSDDRETAVRIRECRQIRDRLRALDCQRGLDVLREHTRYLAVVELLSEYVI